MVKKKAYYCLNWGVIDESVLRDFEEVMVSANYTVYATNEEMYVKLKSEGPTMMSFRRIIG